MPVFIPVRIDKPSQPIDTDIVTQFLQYFDFSYDSADTFTSATVYLSRKCRTFTLDEAVRDFHTNVCRTVGKNPPAIFSDTDACKFLFRLADSGFNILWLDNVFEASAEFYSPYIDVALREAWDRLQKLVEDQ